jgi:hypothetical protein
MRAFNSNAKFTGRSGPYKPSQQKSFRTLPLAMRGGRMLTISAAVTIGGDKRGRAAAASFLATAAPQFVARSQIG